MHKNNGGAPSARDALPRPAVQLDQLERDTDGRARQPMGNEEMSRTIALPSARIGIMFSGILFFIGL